MSYPAFHADGPRSDPEDFGCYIPLHRAEYDPGRAPRRLPPQSPLALAEALHARAMDRMASARRELASANQVPRRPAGWAWRIDASREHRSAAMRHLNACRRALAAAWDALAMAQAEASFTLAEAA